MPQQTTQRATDLHVDPSNETIRLGPLAVRFLLTGDDSNGSVAAFEAYVPSGQRLTALATSFVIKAREIRVGPVELKLTSFNPNVTRP